MDKLKFVIIVIILLHFSGYLFPVSLEMRAVDSVPVKQELQLEFNGQLAGWGAVLMNKPVAGVVGGRFVPTLLGKYATSSESGWDSEASLNINGSAFWSPDSVPAYSGQFKPYRIWLRYYTPHFEVRAGLQKINFGAAKLLRPLMWFDGMDVRDPLQLTDGVYGLLSRYYFDSNATLWAWVLTGNNRPKGYEWAGTAGWKPEVGGRLHYPLGPGEAGVSYHHRKVDTAESLFPTQFPSGLILAENRIGFDGKWDLGVGLWVEGSLTALEKDTRNVLPSRTDLLNLGMDYTFPVGNGLGVTVEYFRYHAGDRFIAGGNKATVLASMLSYPLSLIDNVSMMVFCVPSADRTYWMNYLTWSRTYDKLSLYLIGFVTPSNYSLPVISTGDRKVFAGKGFQLMLSYNF